MANANVKVSYSLICKDLNEAIDTKNKIIANTLYDETVEIKIEFLRDVWTVKSFGDEAIVDRVIKPWSIVW